MTTPVDIRCQQCGQIMIHVADATQPTGFVDLVAVIEHAARHGRHCPSTPPTTPTPPENPPEVPA